MPGWIFKLAYQLAALVSYSGSRPLFVDHHLFSGLSRKPCHASSYSLGVSKHPTIFRFALDLLYSGTVTTVQNTQAPHQVVKNIFYI